MIYSWVTYKEIAAEEVRNCTFAYYENSELDLNQTYAIYQGENQLDCLIDVQVIDGKKVLRWYVIGQELDGSELTIKTVNGDVTEDFVTISGTSAASAKKYTYKYESDDLDANQTYLIFNGDKQVECNVVFTEIDGIKTITWTITGDNFNGGELTIKTSNAGVIEDFATVAGAAVTSSEKYTCSYDYCYIGDTTIAGQDFQIKPVDKNDSTGKAITCYFMPTEQPISKYNSVIGWYAATDNEGGSGVRAYVIEIRKQGSNEWVTYDVVAAENIQSCAIAYYENDSLDLNAEYVIFQGDTQLECTVDVKMVSGKKVLSWYAVGQNVRFDGSAVTIRTAGGDTFATVSGATTASSKNYTYTNYDCCYNGGTLLDGSQYSYRVKAVDYLGNYSAADKITGSIVADYGKPVFGSNASKCVVEYSRNEFNEAVALSPVITWQAASDYTTDSGIHYYAVYIIITYSGS